MLPRLLRIGRFPSPRHPPTARTSLGGHGDATGAQAGRNISTLGWFLKALSLGDCCNDHSDHLKPSSVRFERPQSQRGSCSQGSEVAFPWNGAAADCVAFTSCKEASPGWQSLQETHVTRVNNEYQSSSEGGKSSLSFKASHWIVPEVLQGSS